MFNHNAMPVDNSNRNPSIYGSAKGIVELALKVSDVGDACGIAATLIELVEDLTDLNGRVHIVQDVIAHGALSSETKGYLRRYFDQF